MIKLFYNDTFKNYFLLMLTLFIEEVIFRLCVGLGIIDVSVLRILVGINLFSLVLAALFSFFGRLASNILTFIVGLLCSIFYFLQIGFFKILGVFPSFSMFSQLEATKDFIVQYIHSFSFLDVLIFVPLLILGIFYITCDYRIKVLEKNDEIDFADKFDSEERKKLNEAALVRKKRKAWWNSKANALVISCGFAGLYYFLLISPNMVDNYQLKSNMELFSNPDSSYLAVNKFGVLGYAFNDIKAMVLNDNSIESEYNNKYTIQEQIESDYKRRLDDTMWKRLINNGGSKSYTTLNNYFISQEITDKNDFTGFFKDKNLIIISMAAINNMAINEEYFPNIYKLYTEGWSWDNSYSLCSSCSGIDNELSSITSLYPISNDCTANRYIRNVYPESLFNLFKKNEYVVNSFHNYSEHFFNRPVISPNLGSDKYYGVQALSIPYNSKYSEWPSDKELMEKYLRIISTQNKFVSFLTTSATNLPYDVSSEYGDKNLELFADLPYDISIRRYLSKIKELDDAIGVLLKGLETQDKLNDTVIVLYSSHTPYTLDSKSVSKYLDEDVSLEKNIDKSPFIIYNTGMQGQKFKENISTINIVPTIANLFDLDYDPRLYMGKDVLSPSYDNRVIFVDGSWKDNKAYYDGVKSTINFYDVNRKYNDGEIKEINKVVKERLSMSGLAIKSNYFNVLEANREEMRIKDIEDQKKANEE